VSLEDDNKALKQGRSVGLERDTLQLELEAPFLEKRTCFFFLYQILDQLRVKPGNKVKRHPVEVLSRLQQIVESVFLVAEEEEDLGIPGLLKVDSTETGGELEDIQYCCLHITQQD
jgi:hypothetical protein